MQIKSFILRCLRGDAGVPWRASQQKLKKQTWLRLCCSHNELSRSVLQEAAWQRSRWPLTAAGWCTASAAWRSPPPLCHDTSSSTGWVAGTRGKREGPHSEMSFNAINENIRVIEGRCTFSIQSFIWQERADESDLKLAVAAASAAGRRAASAAVVDTLTSPNAAIVVTFKLWEELVQKLD